MKRRFLLLQGVCTPFFARLADQLRVDGHDVLKVNFNVGDRLYWGGRKAFEYRDRPDGLRDFYDEVFRQEGITDLVLFGDRRPVHRPAVDHAEMLGIRTHVFEEGYFRPYWVTLERDGVNGHSLLPRDPAWFWEAGARVDEAMHSQPFVSRFVARALHDVAYHVAGAANPFLYPHYRTHAPMIAPLEYVGYVRRFSLLPYWKHRDRQVIKNRVEGTSPYFVLPLQLNSDVQIRDHSRFSGMEEVIDFVMASFATTAPLDCRLVIKNHPLDMTLCGYGDVITCLASKYGLLGRVDYLESGNLELLVSHSRGLVTVNSTTGCISLAAGVPTIALSDPIYNLPGLTFQGELDSFWFAQDKPDRELFRRFRNAVMVATQINGGFYCRRGIELAVKNSARVLVADRSPLECLM